MSFSEFRKSEEFQELQLNEAIQAGIESTGIGPGQATQGGVTTQDALDLADSFREDNTDNTNKNKETSKTKTKRPYRNPLRKIANGGVLQYPIDLDTDLQDYFEIQIFRYRAAGGLPGIKQGNQGYEKDRVEKFKKVNNSFETGGYLGASNRRGNRQNFRLQD